MNIGPVEIKGKTALAPLAGVTDIPFRLLCKEMGAPVVFSEMVSAEGLVRGSERTSRYLDFQEIERPIALQLFGGDPLVMKNAAQIIERDRKPDIIDINFGCPVKKIVRNGAGSALLKNPRRMGLIVKAMAGAVGIPVTAKIRSGWDENSIPVTDIGKILEDAGAAAITIHARTRTQLFSGRARWDDIGALKKSVAIPIIGNGDVRSAEDARKMLETTGCDLVMIGRAAMGNPWIFREIRHFLNTGELLKPPSYNEKIEMCLRHIKNSCDIYGDKKTSSVMKKHIGWYLKGMPENAGIKQHIFTANTVEVICSVLLKYRDFLENNSNSNLAVSAVAVN